jgi:hypothetical protein
MSDSDREAEIHEIEQAAAVMLRRMNAQVVINPKKKKAFGSGTPAQGSQDLCPA